MIVCMYCTACVQLCNCEWTVAGGLWLISLRIEGFTLSCVVTSGYSLRKTHTNPRANTYTPNAKLCLRFSLSSSPEEPSTPTLHSPTASAVNKSNYFGHKTEFCSLICLSGWTLLSLFSFSASADLVFFLIHRCPSYRLTLLFRQWTVFI